ncbi:polysaccharide deacetylase family protein [Plantactinospora siamensis]|uniref:Polysaccharide deacetylase family protein n=1 Tax=Plantactinospora siamensis TaxID=555372 RepID=A0ABV6NY72_9ACTN
MRRHLPVHRALITAAVMVIVLVSGTAGCGHQDTRHSGSASPSGQPTRQPGEALAPPGGSPAQGRAAVPSPGVGPTSPGFPTTPAPQPVAIRGGAAAPIYHRLPVHQPVAFLTMDDGQVQLPGAPALMRTVHVPFTMFLIAPVAAGNPEFFRQLVAAGGVIEDHTLTHRSLRGLPYPIQRREICGARDSLRATFGAPPRFFRPPYGNYDHNTLAAVHDCGLEAAFHWSETVREGKVFYQTPDHRIQPGDIILMHFRSTFVQDVTAALTAIRASGLTPALLEDYIR